METIVGIHAIVKLDRTVSEREASELANLLGNFENDPEYFDEFKATTMSDISKDMNGVRGNFVQMDMDEVINWVAFHLTLDEDGVWEERL